MSGTLIGACSSWVKRPVVVALALLVFLGAGTAVGNSGTTRLTGTSEWSQQFSPDFVTTTKVSGSFAGSLGRGTYAGTLVGQDSFTTSTCGPVCQTVTGEFTFSSARGDFTAVVEPGSVVALTDIASRSQRFFRLTLRVVGGTRSYKHADGVMTLTYASDWLHFFDPNANEFISTISDSGTLSGDPR